MGMPMRLRLARSKAIDVLKQHNISSLPIDPFVIAQKQQIIIQPKPDTSEGVSGMLLRNGDSFGILYATHIQNEGFQRFSIAHELGHYFLEGHIDLIFSEDAIHSSHAGFVSDDPYEMEADHFAAGLLMPEKQFKDAARQYEVGLSAIEGLSELCKTSLTATAIRYVELTEEAVAVIMNTGNKIDYCFLSDSMKALKELSWPRKGSPIPKNTATAGFSKDPEKIRQAKRLAEEIDIRDWLGGHRSLPAIEEVMGLGQYGKVLTVLTCDLDEDEIYEDEDEEEDLIESWTPRFRK